ncbi:UNVERIFIED_CONTAM: hypothetical protein Slati_2192400 [Sesamum latifolium]|uniref:Uncharacterized protein n=1 Tax=Sesamum latifolium TaxID=2727402 RepID=A0AAW2WSJ4_9LAMI
MAAEATTGTYVVVISCSRTIEAIIYCMVSKSPGDSFPQEMCKEVLFRGGFVRGLAGLEDLMIVTAPVRARGEPMTTWRA